jgi:3-hydroxyanthranilate 3,4-dioxygenase
MDNRMANLEKHAGRVFRSPIAPGSFLEQARYNELMPIAPPFNLQKWISANRHLLKPPVGNKVLFQDTQFIVMAVGGPNSRIDFHHDPGEEFFYQLEGDMLLRTIQDGQRVDIPIHAGEVFLLPPNVPHSPQRPADSVGLVVERPRLPNERDGFSWYCEACGQQLHAEFLPLENIETQLPAVFERFYTNAKARTCRQCGKVMQRPAR